MDKPARQFLHSDYTVGWICALPTELVAAEAMLDEEHPLLPAADPQDANSYTLGSIGNHNVVIACLPAETTGKVSAATVAKDMIRSFTAVRFGLMVGIGGGVPCCDITEHIDSKSSESEDEDSEADDLEDIQDIRLGDVVISLHSKSTEAVIQFDFGKSLQQKEFIHAGGKLNKPPNIVLSAVSRLQAQHARKGHGISELLSQMLSKNPAMVAKFQYPGRKKDILFKSSVVHVDGKKSCKACREDSDNLVKRKDRYSTDPKVHYGTIGSADQVMKDAILRDKWAQKENIICFEMEAAGLMDSFPCLVIRGICDYADSHKNKVWQPYAASTAAAYAKELLHVIPGQHIRDLPPIFQELVSEIKELNENQKAQTRSTDRINQKISLKGLKTAKGAEFNSYENELQHGNCLPGTRENILRQIEEWAGSPDGKCIFWLNGGAGTGKSTISRTIARQLKESDKMSLGASFFFKRGEEDRGNAKRLFSTLVQQLILCIPELIPRVEKAIEDDPYISDKALGEQFNKLLLQPLLKVEANRPTIAVIVIDALDECQSEEQNEDIKIVLQLLPRVQKSKLIQLRFLLTSRPELPLRLGFKKIEKDHRDMDLHDIPESEIEHDISLFLKHKFSEIREEHEILSSWPEEEAIQILIAKAVPLFISAATLCRFVGDASWNPQQRLDIILKDRTEYVSGMSSTYLPVLNQFLSDQNQRECNRILQEFKQIIGAIILLATPLSAHALSQLLRIDTTVVNKRLSRLHSVLNNPDKIDAPVRIFHLSFRDFLLDTNTKEARESEKFWIDEKAMHQSLTERCIDIMCSRLKKNICDLSSDTIQRNEIDMQTVDSHLLPELQYACQYWVYHLVKSQDPVTQLIKAHSFLEVHFLHWVEAMGVLGIISEVVRIINILQSVMQKNKQSEIMEFLHDAKRFILKNRQIADTAPLQLYSSGLAFASRTSKVRNIFEKEKPNWLYQLPKVEEYWGAEIQTLEDHSDSVFSVIFSPDGQLLASGSYDETIKLWDPATGELCQTLEGHSNLVWSVTFSPNGQLLASGSSDNTIKLWDPTTGELHQTLEGHSNSVLSVTFSSDGQLLASGSSDNTIKLWDPTTGELHQTLKGHSNSVRSVAFSPDGQLLASGSYDDTIKLWDPATGELRQTLEGHSNSVQSVTFSPNGQLLASGSDDNTVKLWDPATGELRQTLEGHSNLVRSVAFSPDGQLLASGSDDDTIKLWDPATGELRQTLEGHSNTVWSVAFSSDGRLLASGSNDSTVKLWDPTTGELRQTLEGHSSWVWSVTFSPDGRLLASGSDDDTVKLWDPATGELRQTLEGHSNAVFSVAFSPDSRLLASGSSGNTVRLWDTTTGELHQTLEGHSNTVWSVAFSSDGRLLASGSNDKTVKLWDPVTGELRQTLEDHSNWVWSVTFSPDGRLLASGSYDNTVKLWDPTTGELCRTLEGHSNSVQSVIFSPDGRLLASSSYDNTVKLWDPATGELRQTLEGHSASVQSVTFSPNGHLLASDSNDKTVKLWDPATGELRQTLEGHNHWAWCKNNAGVSLLKTQWICYQDEKKLWLPSDCRPNVMAMKDGILTLGHTSGRVFFISCSFD